MNVDESRDEPRFKVVDTKEVVVNATGASYLISHKSLTVETFGTFLKLQPSRYRSIARLLTSRCSNDVKQQMTHGFWTEKTGGGKMFLDKLRTIKANAIRMKFSVKGAHRMASRQKHARAKQLVADTVEVPLPTVGAHTGVNAIVVNNHGTLSFQLDPIVLDHLAIMANDFFSSADDNNDANTANGSHDVAVDGSVGGIDDHSSGGGGDENASSCEGDGGTADGDSPPPDAAPELPTKSSFAESALFKALKRGAL